MTVSALAVALKERVALELVALLSTDGPRPVPDDGTRVLNAIDEVLEEFEEPGNFRPMARVTHREMTKLRGTVQRRIDADGELHTVIVLWDSETSALPYSPRELREL